MTHRTLLTAVAAVAVVAAAHTARAELVTNGGFGSNTGNGQLGFNTTATGWSMSSANPPGYTFLYAPGTADTGGANGSYGNVSFWGPGNGSANRFPATSPAGGYFIAAASDFQQDAVQQTLTGLHAGEKITIGFWWAAAQQYTFTGQNQSQWQVSLGSETIDTPLVTIPSQGFSGWMHENFTFTADGTSDVLSFLANGVPQAPPFALLDGVTSEVPEPSSILLGIGVAGVVGVAAAKRRRSRS